MKKYLQYCRIPAMLLALLLGLGTVPPIPATAAEKGRMSLKRPALELSLGEEDQIIPVFEHVSGTPAVTFRSADPSVVTVDQEGRLVAKKVGKTTITVSCASTGDTIELSVKVMEKEHSWDDKIMITTFWPPNPVEMVNDEQYKLLADAGITQVLGAGANMDGVETTEKMLAMCDKYGMGLTMSSYFGPRVTGWTDEEFRTYTSYYKNVPAAYGVFMADEPLNGNGFVNAYLGLRKYIPNLYCHLNFLPEHYYGNSRLYQSLLTDYARLIADGGDKLEYLMFDMYPYGLEAGSMARVEFFSNLRSVYEVGHKNQVKTGLYIQTVCIPNAFRRPTDSEIRYEMYAALAFGFKQLSFFTWFTPTGQGEPFTDGIIAADGTPNSHYYAIKDINHEIHALGDTLVKCDTHAVYLTGRKTYGQPAVPEDFFAQIGHDSDTFIFSWMRHRETGRNYLMVVNNNFTRKQTGEIIFDSAITSVSEVSKTDGSLRSLSMDGQTLVIQLEAGDAMLIALPEDFDFYQAPEGQPPAETNLAADALIYASSSEGWNGNFIYNLNDGSNYTAMDADRQIWRSLDAEDSYIKIDLGRTLDFDRVDVYPIGGMFNYGDAFPNNITVSISDDGQTWREVKSVKDITITELRGYTLRIGDQTARWIKLDFTDTQNAFGYVAVDEVEVYNDKGRLPEPALIPFLGDDTVVTYTEGENIALGKKGFATSSAEQIDWSLNFINDGNRATGFASAVFRNTVPDVTEFAGVSFGDLFAVEEVTVTLMHHTPEDFRIELSEDLKNWTAIYDVTGAAMNTQPITVTLDTPVNARYVRVIGTRMRDDINGGGYLIKIGEIEAYGKPVCDKTDLERVMATYRTEGGDPAGEVYAEAEAAMGNALLTQSQAQDLIRRLYAAIGRNPDGSEIPPETEPETTAPTEPESTTTESDTTDEETGITGSETTATADETAASDTSASEPAQGCASAVGSGATLALLAGAALTLKKRKKNR